MDLRSFFEYIGAGAGGAGKHDAISGTVRAMREQAQQTLKALELLEALRTSWNQPDPGKGTPYVFFVRDYTGDWLHGTEMRVTWCDAFFARGFVSDLDRAQEGVRSFPWEGFKKPTAVPLGDFREAKQEPCYVCRKLAYVVGKYWQSCDSPDGDTWSLELLLLCPDCLHVERIGRRSEGYRFGHLLKRPGR